MNAWLNRMTARTRCPPRPPLTKIAWSWLGSFAGIYALGALNRVLGLSPTDNVLLIGSFGASAVLLYGAPLAEFSQPRNVVGGHVLSAVVGVAVQQWLPLDLALAAALAVSLSIALMHLTRTLHPPGGATALIAVVGGEGVHALGYGYAFSPVAVGALVLLLVAVVVNNLSGDPQRHYPQYWL